MNRLTPFQMSMARLFFGVARSRGYLLGGGGALLAHGLISRPTQDLDFVGSPSTERADSVAAQFAHTAESSGIASRTVQRGDTFTRLTIGVETQLVIDFAIDVAPILDPVITDAGPTFAPEELAARKLTALFGRAEARDFADIFARCQVFPKDLLIARAKQIDRGFNDPDLADALRSVRRFEAADMPAVNAPIDQVVEFFLAWAESLVE